jgi:photosystem II stability/assembly factor-like uncharacterized protein
MKKSFYLIIIFSLISQFSFSQYVYNWYPLQSGTTNNLNYIDNFNFIERVVGTSGTILISTSGGSNWTSQYSGTGNELRFIGKPIYSFITGSLGTILKSPNGINWIVLSSGTNQTLNSIVKVGFITLIAVGNLGVILSSTDLGTSWSPVTSGTSNNLYSIVSNLSDKSWIVGANGTILNSTNSGLNWHAQQSGSSVNLNFLYFVDDNNLWIVGANGKILRTTNSGINWINVVSGTTGNLKTFHLYANNGWAFGANGTVIRTTNGGLNWLAQPGFTNQNINSSYFATDDNIYVVGDGGIIFQRRVDTNYFPYVFLNRNNINSIFYNSGIIDQDMRTSNTPGFEWPKGSGSFAIFSAGLTSAALYNGSLRMASDMYLGEYLPGYVADSAGIPVGKTDLRFKFYKVKRGDNMNNNPDWANWGQMVPFGAPFVDVNHNGTYEPNIDTPGMKNAVQTIFICLTDGFIESHKEAEGFGGGTLPLYAETHMTAWCYDNPDLMDVQFIRWNIINKSHVPWNSAYFSITADPDLGCPLDDYIGCDTTRELGFCYNAEDVDCNFTFRYPGIVPAVGFLWLRCGNVSNTGISSIDYVAKGIYGGPQCEWEPNPGAVKAYNFMRGCKSDLTPWVIPPGGPLNITKFCFSGDPETGLGWCEAQSQISGSVRNCGGPNVTTGTIVPSNQGQDRRLLMNSGSDNLTINLGDTQKILIAQLIAQGNSRKNSVTKLKILADTVKAVCNRGFIIGIEPISTSVPLRFNLYQNYPNPFNPTSKIKFQIGPPLTPLLGKQGTGVVLKIYDILGQGITTLVNEKLNPGTYEVEFDGSNYPSGVYFYKLSVGSFNQSKKMVLLK